MRSIFEEHKLDPEGDVILVLDRKWEGNPGKTYNVQVSSKHLMLASPVFKTMLSGNFAEGTTFRSKGSLELPLPDDHGKALMILLNIIHGRIRQLPSQLSADRLTSVAILINKYQFQNVVGVLTNLWYERVPSWKSEDDFDDEEEFSWRKIFVTWTLKRRREFKEATREALWDLRAKDELDDDYMEPERLHLPANLITKIFSKQKQAMSTAITLITHLHSTYTHSVYKCNPSCDTMLLGALSRVSMELSRVTETFVLSEWSYRSLVHMLLDQQWSINFRTHCLDCEVQHTTGVVRKVCGNRSTIDGFIEALDGGVEPLELEKGDAGGE